ncbi:DEAD-box type RNA helicase [Friedmanniomyces endolithicus]|nr:DEAD-box type RNA helicase [Friedmanniomyces endolithicus]
MTDGEKATFFISIDGDIQQEQIGSDPEKSYIIMERAFMDVKTVFAEYNKWDEYSMILLFKDVEMAHHERLVENNGTTTPWLGDQQGPLEKALSPRMLRVWEGQLLPYMFCLQRRGAAPMHDITFERKAASRLGGLGLVRLDPLKRRASGGRPEVEVVQGRAIVTCPPEVSSAFLPRHRLVPIMWEFRRVQEGPSDRYRPIATRFRVHQTLGGQEAQSDRSACLARICKLKRQKGQVEVVYQLVPSSSLAPALTNQAAVWGLKVQSIIPLEREYGALQGLQYYDLCQQIIRAAPSKRIVAGEKAVAGMREVWGVNRAQGEAIYAVLENEGFSLIQGPPGSGKTKTIVAIVGGLLSQTLGSAGTGSGVTRIAVPKGAGGGQGVGEGAGKKLLVCAPSNAAVDELVMRLKGGVTTRNGKRCQINVVRIGRSEAINSQVLDVTMDELVAKRLGGNTSDKEAARAKNAEVFKQHESVSAALRALYLKRDSGELKGQALGILENEIVAVRKRKNDLGVRIDTVKDAERNAGREAELSRKRAQQAVLDDAHVICATLSGSGHDMFQALNIEFETVIIDEAAQCVEMSSLIPLKYGCVKCVMVGDPKQLPPTVFSKEAARFQYEQSLFVRMQNNAPGEVHLLDTQYRMHPAISLFPSKTFYDGLLRDGEGMAGLRQRAWHRSRLLAPYRFFDVQGQQHAAPKGHSLVNTAEVEVAIALYERLTADFGEDVEELGRAVGVITPYKSQLRLLKERFAQKFGQGIFEQVEFNTTDAFQGRESEVIIFSCVRASPGGGIGFLNDIRRMNVGLTRAKSSLWVLGNSASLGRGQYWRLLVEDAKTRGVYETGDVMGMLRKPSSAFPAKAAVADSRNGMVDSRRPSGSIAAAKAADPRKALLPSRTGLPNPARQETEKMEGIRYRFEDRVVSKKRPASPDSSQDNDFEMQDAPDAPDADFTLGGTEGAVPSLDGVMSRDETPLSHTSASGAEAQEGSSIRANGTVTKRAPAVVAPSAVPQAVRKKAAASPFMPAKKKVKPAPR